MSLPSQESIQAAKRLWEDKNCTKGITCPEHPTWDHAATLFTAGHRYEGTWECPITGDSDAHEHDAEHYEIEEDEIPSSNPDSSYYYTRKYYVCGGDEGCGVAIDLDIADPELDAAEAREDYEADNWRDE